MIGPVIDWSSITAIYNWYKRYTGDGWVCAIGDLNIESSYSRTYLERWRKDWELVCCWGRNRKIQLYCFSRVLELNCECRVLWYFREKYLHLVVLAARYQFCSFFCICIFDEYLIVLVQRGWIARTTWQIVVHSLSRASTDWKMPWNPLYFDLQRSAISKLVMYADEVWSTC